MKKFLVMVLVLVMLMILALVLVGCGGTSTTPATPTSTVNAIDQALCNPDQTVKDDAAAVANFIQTALSTGAAIYPPLAPISGVSVANIFTTIQQGGCSFAEDIKAALAWFDSLTGAKAPKPAAKALRAWVK